MTQAIAINAMIMTASPTIRTNTVPIARSAVLVFIVTAAVGVLQVQPD
jgi:hypothetical protein